MTTTVKDQLAEILLSESDYHEDECHECENKTVVAVGYALFSEGCEHSPNPTLLCEDHYSWYRDMATDYGWDTWLCNQCPHTADLLRLTRGRP